MADSSGITVAICTRNRVDTLQQALNSLQALPEMSVPWSVLVVDNGSTDDTRDYLRRICPLWPEHRLRVIDEPVPGLSVARNRAIREATGEVIAFIDDDSVVSPEWLTAVTRTFERHPGAGVVGGPIHAVWMDGAPDWLHPDLLDYFSSLDYGSADSRLTYPRYPYGANFCLRRSMTLKIGGFRTDLGYRGKVLIGGEETDLAMRAENAGWEIWYCAQAAVDHLIQSQRTSEAWLMRRAYSGGLTETLMQRSRLRQTQCAKSMLDDIRWLRYAAAQRRVSGDTVTRIRNEARYRHALGKCRGWWSINKLADQPVKIETPSSREKDHVC